MILKYTAVNLIRRNTTTTNTLYKIKNGIRCAAILLNPEKRTVYAQWRNKCFSVAAESEFNRTKCALTWLDAGAHGHWMARCVSLFCLLLFFSRLFSHFAVLAFGFLLFSVVRLLNRKYMEFRAIKWPWLNKHPHKLLHILTQTDTWQ